MKRLLAVLAVLGIAPLGGTVGWARNPDLLHVGTRSPVALEGSYQTAAGQLQFLVLGSPEECNDGSDPSVCPHSLRVYFYNQACNRINDVPVPAKPNGVTILPLHSPAVTPNRAGNFLISAAGSATPSQPIPADNQIAGLSFFVDANLGIGRVQELARIEERGNVGWLPYSPGAVLLFAPPDDGATFTDTLLLRCPVGATPVVREVILATPGTLGGDMLDIAWQTNDHEPGAATFIGGAADRFTLRARIDAEVEGTFAVSLTAVIFDTNGNLLGVANLPCQCSTEVRLAAVSPVAGATATYWEIFGVGPAGLNGLFAGAFNLQVRIGGVSLNLFHRLHHALDQQAYFP